MGELDEVLSVTWDDGALRGPARVGAVGVAHGDLGEGWLIGHAINGGVLMALGVSAASSGLASVGHPDVLTWGAHFLSAAPAGPVEVRVEVLRVGRTVSTAQVRVLQPGDDGRPHERVRLTATFGSLDDARAVRSGRRACPSATRIPSGTARRTPLPTVTVRVARPRWVWVLVVWPVAVTRMRLQVLQKLLVSGVMKPSRPPVSAMST